MGIEVNIEVCTLFDMYGNMLTEKQQQIVKDYYFCNTSLSELAEIYGVSRQAVRDILNRSVQTLHDCENKLGIVSKTEKVMKELSALYKAEDSTMQKQRIQRIIDKIKE